MRITFLIKLVLLAYASQFVIGPLVIYFYSKQSANPRFTAFDLASPPLRLPPNYMQSVSLLEPLGFQPVAHLFGGVATNLRLVLTLCVNRMEKEIATVVYMLCDVPPATRVLHSYTEFCTEFDDGHEMSTSNSNHPALFVVAAEKEIFRLPHLTNPQHLYEVHRALTRRRVGPNKRLALPGQEVAELIDCMKRDLAREAAYGGLALDRSGEWYRPTMRGAIYSTFVLIWPLGMLRRMSQRRRGVRLAAEVLQNRPLYR